VILLKISFLLVIGLVRHGDVMAMNRGSIKTLIEKAPSKKRKKTKKTKKTKKIPEKYLAGLSAAEKAKRKKEILKNAKKSPKDPSAYAFATDRTPSGKLRKTKISKHTKAYRKMYG